MSEHGAKVYSLELTLKDFHAINTSNAMVILNSIFRSTFVVSLGTPEQLLQTGKMSVV